MVGLLSPGLQVLEVWPLEALPRDDPTAPDRHAGRSPGRHMEGAQPPGSRAEPAWASLVRLSPVTPQNRECSSAAALPPSARGGGGRLWRCQSCSSHGCCVHSPPGRACLLDDTHHSASQDSGLSPSGSTKTSLLPLTNAYSVHILIFLKNGMKRTMLQLQGGV